MNNPVKKKISQGGPQLRNSFDSFYLNRMAWNFLSVRVHQTNRKLDLKSTAV